MAQYFNVQIVNIEDNSVFSEAVHYAKDYAACKQIPRNCVIDGEVSNSLQLTAGKGQAYAYFAHPAAEKGKVFYIKLEPQEFVNLNSRKFELRAKMIVPNVGKLETPKGFFTKMNAEALKEAELTQSETPAPGAYVNPASAEETPADPAPKRNKREKASA
jgi:hypothetical protein